MSSAISEEMPENIKKQFTKAYSPFSDKLSLNDFISRIAKLNEEDAGNLLRASLAFQQSQKCVECNQNIAMVLLCASVEAMNPKATQIEFKIWLIDNKISDLEMKHGADLRKTINSAYEEFLKVPEREGAYSNFRQFLLDYCPLSLRQGPFGIYKRRKPPLQPASFDESLSYIYAKFRSLYVHEALGKLPTQEDLEETKKYDVWMGWRSLDLHREDAYSIKLEKVLEWFPKVVKESLYNYLVNQKIN